MAVRRYLFLSLLAIALVVPLAGPAAAHETDAHAERAAVAEPSTEGDGKAMEAVANAQYKTAEGRGQGGSDVEFIKLGAKEYALAGTLRNGLQIVDITDPKAPSLAGHYDCPIYQGDVQVWRNGERVLAAYTADSRINSAAEWADAACIAEANDRGAEIDGTELGTFILDVTDPAAPTTVSFIEIPKGSHNQTVHPSGDYLYNSNSDLVTRASIPQITIHDISDPANPRHVQDFKWQPRPGLGSESHDLFFNGDGTRAYVAAVSSTLILDTSNPEAPSIISQIYDPEIEVVHQSDVVSLPREDGSLRELLIITDEQGGAAVTAGCPGGGLHIYDVTGELEESPKKQGRWFIPHVAPQNPLDVCTAHVLRIHPDQAMLTIAWYTQGVRVLDISGLADFEGSPTATAFGEGVGMTEIGNYVFDDADTWSFKTNRIEADGSFYGYGNDIARGFDVYRFDGTDSELDVPALEPEDFAADDLCSGVPEATSYVDRGEARDTHERSIDCVIYRVIAQGIVKDLKWFYEPRQDVTREQMATFVVSAMRAAGVDAEFPEAPEEDKFDDIGESAHRGSINLLAEAGIINGTSKNKYSPNEPISRQQMATFMVKAAEFALGEPLPPGQHKFTDVKASNLHNDTIGSGAFAGLFSGTSESRFSPSKNVERDQMASFLTNLLNQAGDSQTGQPGRQ